MNIIKLRHVEFTLATGDIFDAKVDAIVNSEQTDFVLSGNPESLSGQIWKRYGDGVQRELDTVTNGQVLGPGYGPYRSWWEATPVEKTGDTFKLRWRDYSSLPPVIRPRRDLALICPDRMTANTR